MLKDPYNWFFNISEWRVPQTEKRKLLIPLFLFGLVNLLCPNWFTPAGFLCVSRHTRAEQIFLKYGNNVNCYVSEHFSPQMIPPQNTFSATKTYILQNIFCHISYYRTFPVTKSFLLQIDSATKRFKIKIVKLVKQNKQKSSQI